MPKFIVSYRVEVGSNLQIEIESEDFDEARADFDAMLITEPGKLFRFDELAKEVESGSAYQWIGYDSIRKVSDEQ